MSSSFGTQLSIVGWRDAVPCHSCDAEVIESVGTTDTPIAEDYLSAAILDRTAPAPLSRPQEDAVLTSRTDGPQEQLTAEGTVLHPTVVLLLGTRVGPTTRLDALERSGHDPASLAAWVGSTWGPEDRSTGARQTLITLADHWLARGWTTTDLAAELRPQEHA